MKEIITFILIIILSHIPSIGQQNVNSAGKSLISGEYQTSYSIGEPINSQFRSDIYAIKAGVLQFFKTGCAKPAVFSLMNLATACIPENGNIQVELQGSEKGVQYLLLKNGNIISDSIRGTGNRLVLGNVSQDGTYTVRASYVGKSCYSDMSGALMLREVPRINTYSPERICSGSLATITLTSNEEVNVLYRFDGGISKSLDLDLNGSNIELNPSVEGNAITISAVYSKNTGCFNELEKRIEIPVFPLPELRLKQTIPGCDGEDVRLTYNASEAVAYSFSYGSNIISGNIFTSEGSLSLVPSKGEFQLSVYAVRSLLSGCLKKDTLIVPFRILEKPQIEVSDLSSCSGEEFTILIKGDSETRVTWSAEYSDLLGGKGSGNISDFLSERLTNVQQNSLTVTYHYFPFRPENPACQGIPVTSRVTVFPNSNWVLPNTPPAFCSNKDFEIPINVKGHREVTWRREDGRKSGTGTIKDQLYNQTSQPITVDYFLTLNGCLEKPTGKVSVIIKPAIKLDINRFLEKCNPFTDLTEENVTKGSTPGLKFKYFEDASLTKILSNAKMAIHGTYYIQGEKDGCAEQGSITIRSPLKWNILDSLTICPGNKTDLRKVVDTLTSSSNQKYSFWKDNQATQAVENPLIVGAGIYHIRVDAETPIGTCSAIISTTIREARPLLLNSPGNFEVCSGDPWSYKPNLSEGIFQWKREKNMRTGEAIQTGTGEINLTHFLPDNLEENQFQFNYSYGVIGCAMAEGLFTVTVNANPTFTLVDNFKICDGYVNLSELTIPDRTGITFRFFKENLLFSDPTKGIQGQYLVEGKYGNGCITKKIMNVGHVLEFPDIPPFTVCPPLTFNLKTGIAAFTKLKFNAMFDDIPNPERVGDGIYPVRLKDSNGKCAIIFPVKVVSGEPKILNQFSDSTLCSMENLLFKPIFNSENIQFNWSSKLSGLSGKDRVEMTWKNESLDIIRDTLMLTSYSKICEQRKTAQIEISVLPTPPTLMVSSNSPCSEDPLIIDLITGNLPENSYLTWKAMYGKIQGGIGTGTINLLGKDFIRERLFQSDIDSAVATYFFTPFILGPYSKVCSGPIDTLNVRIRSKISNGCSVSVSGLLQTVRRQSIEGVDVRLAGINGEDRRHSEVAGNFSFSGLSKGNDYTVYPELNSNPMNGVSTFDLMLIQKHILNLRTIENPYDLVSADINRSGDITISDFLQLRKMILGIDREFKENKSWRFVDSRHRFEWGKVPFKFPEIVNLSDVSGFEEMNLVGMKIGDINGSAITNSYGIAEPRENDTYTLRVNGGSLKKGDLYYCSFYADETKSSEGIQFTLQFDKEYLEPELNLIDSQLLRQIGFFGQEGMMTFSFSSDIKSGNILFRLPFRVKEESSLEKLLNLSDRITPSEAYLGEKVLPLKLEFMSEIMDKPQLLGVFPNPFRDKVQFRFFLPWHGKAVLSLYDMNGKLFRSIHQDVKWGQNEMVIENLPVGSSWIYRISSRDWSESGTVISSKN